MKTSIKGFSLLELIASLVIIAITATGLFVYLQGFARGGDEPLQLVQQQIEVNGLMETLIAEYNRYLTGNANWQAFVGLVQNFQDDTDLRDRGILIDRVDLTGAGNVFAGAGFQVFRVTVQGGDLVLNGLFSE